MNTEKLRHIEKIKPYILAFASYWVILLSFLLSDSIFHHIGNSIVADENPINTFTALNLLFASTVSAMVLSRHIKGGEGRKYFILLWIVISAGLLFAAFDEQFEVHEAIGKNIDALIYDTSVEISFHRIFDEGDQFVIIFYFAGGLLMSAFFLKLMISSRETAYFFIGALIFQGIAALCDNINVVTALSGIYSESTNYTGYIEEICEFTSSLMFWMAMISEFMLIQIVKERTNKINT